MSDESSDFYHLFQNIAQFVERHLNDRRARNLPIDELTMTERYVLMGHREWDEVLDEIPWKDHRYYEDRTIIQDNIAEELIDTIFVAFSTAHVNKIDYYALLAAGRTKQLVIEHRWKQEHTPLHPQKPVVIIDIDGVLADWPDTFLTFARREGYNVGESLEAFQKNNPIGSKQAKHRYRQSGIKRVLPAIAANVYKTRQLHELYNIVLLSTRPAHRYSRILGDTLFWLDNERIPFDRLIFTEDKPLKIALGELADKTIAFAVDDDADNVDKLRDLGIKTYWLGRDIETMEDLP